MYKCTLFFVQVLIPKLKETDSNPAVTICVLAAIGELAQVILMHTVMLRVEQHLSVMAYKFHLQGYVLKSSVHLE